MRKLFETHYSWKERGHIVQNILFFQFTICTGCKVISIHSSCNEIGENVGALFDDALARKYFSNYKPESSDHWYAAQHQLCLSFISRLSPRNKPWKFDPGGLFFRYWALTQWWHCGKKGCFGSGSCDKATCRGQQRHAKKKQEPISASHCVLESVVKHL